MRIGYGYDVHQLKHGRKLILGGVEIPFDKGLLGHSDADVLSHAIADALLGAAALGDIGTHFPDTDKAFEGISSLVLLKRVSDLLQQEGLVIGNIDATVVLDKPKLAPYGEEIRRDLEETLKPTVESVSVKATTSEKMGFAGRQEGVAVHACALLT
jgi:2-C-methyl-D-erythritol 2,4-cyclodiphosphate synthase